MPTADQPWFGADGKPLQYEYLFGLDKAARQSGAPVSVSWGDIAGKPSSFPPSAHTHEQSDIVGLAASLSGKQPVNSNLTDISGLTTTSFGRGLLTQADASALRSTAGLVIGTDVVAQSHVGSGGASHAAVIAGGASGFMTGTDKTKLDGIAASADVTASSFGAWTAYTPTVSAGSGSFTSVSASGAYRQIGKTVFIRIRIPIVTNGTAASSVIVTVPAAPKSGTNQTLFGLESAVSLAVLQAIFSGAALYIRNLDLSYPGADGKTLNVNGVYEAD